ncbi:BTAD domain-containing putative transcriptional regulator [Blastococcus sp. SYSU D00669]
MELRVAVLGPTRVTRGGADEDLGGRKPAEVLALLAAAEGRQVPADALADRLWRGSPPATAATTLQGYVSRLRRVLDPGRGARDAQVLVTRGDGYALVLDRAAVDAHAFADLVREGTAADDATAVRLLPGALALWQDRPYADVADVPELAPVTVRLAELRLAAVERLAAARLALGGGAESVPELAELAAAEPLRESTAALLARALHRAGRPGEALDVLRRVRERIADELGLDPSPELRALETGLLRQDPALAPPRPAAARTADGFVGRPRELAALADAWAVAGRGGGTAVVVTGEPGIGKTRLVEAFAARARAAARWGRCAEIGGAPPYWMWQQVLGGLPEGALGSDAGARFALGLDTARRLRALAGPGPLLVVLDDLQWADRDSLSVLEVVLSQLHDAPVLLAMTCREEATGRPELTRVLGLAARLPGARRLRLAGLDDAEVAELVARLGVGADAARVRAVAERSAGNPFFVGELAALPDDPATAVPAGVRDVLRLRLDGLDPAARAVLEVAAVAGRELSLALLGAVAAVDGVPAALRAGLLVEPAPGRVRIAHDLVREALMADLPPARRAGLHGRLADALEAGPAAATSASAIAVHRSEAAAGAADPAAAQACLRAAREALDRAGADDAARLAERGLRHAPQAGTELTADLELVRGSALRRLGLIEASGAALRAAADAARRAGDAARLARAAIASAGGGLGGYWATFGSLAATDVGLLEDAAARADDLPAELGSAVLAALAVQRASVGRSGGRELAARALAVASSSPARSRAAVARFVADWSPRHAPERVELARSLVRDAAGDPVAEATGLHLLRCALVETVQAEEAAAVSRRFTEVATRRGDGDLLLLDAWWRSGLALARGETDEARRVADGAVADAPATSPAAADVTRMSRQTVEGIAAWHEHRLPDVVPAAVDLAATVDPDWLGVLAQAHAQAGRRDAALAAVDRLLAHPGEGVRATYRAVVLADVYLELGEAERAATVLPELESYGDTVVVLWAGWPVLGPTALYRGGLRALRGEPGAAAELERALEICELFGFRPYAARARALLALSSGRR